MRKTLKAIGDRLQAFVDQRDDVALVLESAAADALPVLKILEGLEEESAAHLFWTATDDFVDPAAYAGAVVRGFAARHDAVRLRMGARGLSPWPPVPAAVLDEAARPAARLRALAAFSRDLLPQRDGGNAVWVFYPLAVADDAAFAALMAEVLDHEFPFPWCHHLRFVVRVDPGSEAAGEAFGGRPRVAWYRPDLGMEAVERGLAEEVADESLPLAERMALVPIMAGNDFARGRHAEALEKYELLLAYHARAGNHAMAALALNGMGEVYERTGDLERANASYEAALAPASHGDHPAVPVLLNAVVNLANLRARQARWADAEAYFDVAQQVATVARNAPSKIAALGGRGDCQREQRKYDEALRSWGDGAVIAAQLQDVGGVRTLLARMEGQYAELGEYASAHAVRAQRLALDAPDGEVAA